MRRRQDLISQKTRNEFREYLVGWYLREIEQEFADAGIQVDLEYDPGTQGQRRTLVEQHYRTVDFTDPKMVSQVLKVYEHILIQAEDGSSQEDAKRVFESLCRWLRRDGYEYSDGRIHPLDEPLAARKLYRLDPAPLGVGGQAQVFRAVRKSDGLEVAFKKRLGSQPDDIGRFRREVELLSTFDHPNIMPVFDIAPDFSWFTMPLATGDLTEYRAEVAANEQLVCALVRHVLAGLQGAHARGVCHRVV